MTEEEERALLWKHNYGPPNNRYLPVRRYGDGKTWLLQKNRFGDISIHRVEVDWVDRKPVYGESEFHIYREQMRPPTQGKYGPLSLPVRKSCTHMESVWGQKALREAMARHKKPGYRVFCRTSRFDKMGG